MGSYDQHFYDAINTGASRSATAICGWMHELIEPKSILDVGCGEGSWLAAWDALGVSDIVGLDGAHVDRARLRIPADRFQATDLRSGFRLGRRFDLVESLEVAEHLPPASGDGLIESLAAHGDAVLFSAAPPGQFGVGHVNERPYEHWRAQFAAAGFDCYDAVRSRFARDRSIEPWYRYNAFLFLRRGAEPSGSERLKALRVPTGVPLRDVAALPWRARNAVFRIVPRCIASTLATLSARARSRLQRR
jgi:SAM-dependent methyltransferase